jgi:RNA polymerase sigma factor (sigma-70 family)
MELDDLYRKAYQGDSPTEEQLFKLLTVMFRMFIRRRGVGHEDLEDIVQGALAKVASSYRRDTVKSNFAAWAQTVVKSQFIDFCRSQSSRQRRQVELDSQQSSLSDPSCDPTLISRLKECLRKLHAENPLHARIVNLHYLGYTTDEVCRQLGITTNHRRVVLCRARAMLRACLKEGKRSHE